MNAKAYADNDAVIILWNYDRKINNCLGFCLERIDMSGNSVHILPAWVGFEGEDHKDRGIKDTGIWPIQRYKWIDLTAQWDKNYKYRVSPMVGMPGKLSRTTDTPLILETNEISLSAPVKKYNAFFNRGILSTQPGSHDPGYKTSHKNDGNLLIIIGNRELAKTGTAHVMDVYEHDRRRFTLPENGKDEQGNFNAFSSLIPTDAWQDKYFVQSPAPGSMEVKAPRKDMVFWKGRDKVKDNE
jgi:hypothetical protein